MKREIEMTSSRSIFKTAEEVLLERCRKVISRLGIYGKVRECHFRTCSSGGLELDVYCEKMAAAKCLMCRGKHLVRLESREADVLESLLEIAKEDDVFVFSCQERTKVLSRGETLESLLIEADLRS